ncbi:Protoporphyrinogen oxidase [Gyrodon lividus]|nr:Protoporphyrinogen oxidase [Gyrodon lividus]
MLPESIAVLGGGITGLSAAFHLSRRFPTTRITVINKDTRFGGWVRSERARLTFTDQSGNQEEARVLLEAGPRTLRPNARSVLELVHLLNLSSSLITVPKSSALLRTHFLHIPGSEGIQHIPSSPLDIVKSFRASNAHLGRLLISSLLKEPFKRRNRPPGAEDESVDEFLSRRCGSEFARVFGSAFVHGIHAADSRKVSLRSAFPSLWAAEERGHGSIVAGLLRAPDRPKSSKDDLSYDLGELQDQMRHVTVYSFNDGIGTLVNALVKYLREQPNVRMYGGVTVMGLRLNSRNKRFQVSTSSQETLFPTHVVSALPLHQLQGVLSQPIPHLTANTYSSMTVVNIVFPSLPPSSPALHPNGFGYLIPRPVDGYSAAKGSGILGCVFDSSWTAAQDISHGGRGITKMTVMLGGPYASPTPCGSSSPAPPSSEVDIPRLISELSHQLNQPLPPPLLVKVHSAPQCIPLYSVGHLQRMEELKRVLASEPWNGRMEIVGAGVGGASIGDCVEAGRNAGRNWS